MLRPLRPLVVLLWALACSGGPDPAPDPAPPGPALAAPAFVIDHPAATDLATGDGPETVTARPAAAGADPALGVRWSGSRSHRRLAVVRPAPSAWKLRVDRSRAQTLRTALARAGGAPGPVCGRVVVDGTPGETVCPGAGAAETPGRRRRGARWHELAVPRPARPGTTSVLRFEAWPAADGPPDPAAAPRASGAPAPGGPRVAWSDPRLDPEPAPEARPAPDVLLVVLSGVAARDLGQGHSPVLDALAAQGLWATGAWSPSADPTQALDALLGLGDPGGAALPALRQAGHDTAAITGDLSLAARVGLAVLSVPKDGGDQTLPDEARDRSALRALRRRWIDAAVPDRPRFALLQLVAGGPPYHLPRAALGADGADPPLPARGRTAKKALDQGKGLVVSPGRAQGATAAQLQAVHAGDLAGVDRRLGALLADLAARPSASEAPPAPAPGLPLPANTVLVITATHGEPLGDQGLRRPGTGLWPATQRVPLIVLGPGIDPAKVDGPVPLSAVAGVLRAAAAGAPIGPALLAPAPGPALLTGGRRSPWLAALRRPGLLHHELLPHIKARGTTPVAGARSRLALDAQGRPEPGAVPVPAPADAALTAHFAALPGLHLRCPAPHGALSVGAAAPLGAVLLPDVPAGARLAVDRRLWIPARQDGETWAIFAEDDTPEAPAGCTLRREPAALP